MSDNNFFDLYIEKLLPKLTNRNLIKPTVVLGALAIAAIITFITILIHAIFTKLDSNTEYSINVLTQVVQYEPNDSSIPSANLSEFTLLKGFEQCQGLDKNEWYKSGDLTFYKGSAINILLIRPNVIQLNIEPKTNNARLAQLITKKGRCIIKDKLTANIKLTEDAPDFIMILVGNIILGKKLSYATSSMPALLNSGQIEVKDTSFWFEDPIALPTITLSTGDTVLIPLDNKNATTGLLTVSFDDDFIAGVFNKKGGEVRIVKPFASNEGSPISISFFERLYSDNALAIALSISFIIIQVLMFLITTLIRLTYIPKDTNPKQALPILPKDVQDFSEKDLLNDKTD